MNAPQGGWTDLGLPSAPPPRRSFPLPVILGVVVAVALAIGIPVGLLVSSAVGAADTGSGTPIAGSSPAPIPQAPPPAVVDPPEVGPADPQEETPPEPTGPPSGLSAAQANLWNALSMQGVDSRSCRAYPDGEGVTDGVVASIECDIVDPSFTEPAVYYQFADAVAVDEYLELRASEVDDLGDCMDGGESVGSWNTASNGDLGTLVCVYNTKEGTTFFKMVWSLDADNTVAVVQAVSPSTTYSWWFDNGASQFFI